MWDALLHGSRVTAPRSAVHAMLYAELREWAMQKETTQRLSITPAPAPGQPAGRYARINREIQQALNVTENIVCWRDCSLPMRRITGTVGAAHFESSWTRSLKAPGVDPTLEPKM
jgi:hypothetical protein